MSGDPDAQSPVPDTPSEDALSPGSFSQMFAQTLGGMASRAGVDPTVQSSTGQVMWQAMGGWRGVVESVLPGLVFVVVFTLTLDPDSGQGNLGWSLGLSVGLAAVFTVLRLVQRSALGAVLGGLCATGLAAALALLTGRGQDNFVPGLLTNAGYGTALFVSAVIGWPVLGIAIGWLMGEATAWRRDRRKRRVFTWLTIAWAGLFAARLAVQYPLYLAGEVALLGTLKIVMGLPLFAPMVAVSWLAVRTLYPRGRAAENTADMPASQ